MTAPLALTTLPPAVVITLTAVLVVALCVAGVWVERGQR